MVSVLAEQERAVLEALKSGRPRKPNSLREELYLKFKPADHGLVRSAIWSLLDEGKIKLTVGLKLQIKK